jgi:hypothetical protein
MRLEALLKVIVSPVVTIFSSFISWSLLTKSQDPPDGFILNYTLLIGDASFSNFQKVRMPVDNSSVLSGTCRSLYFLGCQILDLKGTAKIEQNSLLDSFLTITSTKTDLESTSFLSALDMDPSMALGATLGSPGSSRTTLPLSTAGGPNTDSIFGSLGGPPPSGPPTGSSTDGSTSRGLEPAQKREVFDIRRFVTFGLRRSETLLAS